MSDTLQWARDGDGTWHAFYYGKPAGWIGVAATKVVWHQNYSMPLALLREVVAKFEELERAKNEVPTQLHIDQ